MQFPYFKRVIRNKTVVTTHTNADMDSLASMILAEKLYPNALLCFSGAPERNVQAYMENYGLTDKFTDIKNVNFREIKKLVLVDTKSPKRIGKFTRLLREKDVEIDIFDHHPPSQDDIQGTGLNIQKEVGANTTIMIEFCLNRDRNLLGNLPEYEYTLYALGIYSDTNNFTAMGTTREDFHIAGYLIDMGASLAVISSFLNKSFSQDQVHIMDKILNSLKSTEINGVNINISAFKSKTYVKEVSAVVKEVQGIEGLDNIFAVIEFDKITLLIGKSSREDVNIGEIMQVFGGGGHKAAGSAKFNNLKFSEARKKLLNVLKDKVDSQLLAKDIMVREVITIPESMSNQDARDIAARYQHITLPVLNNDKVFKGLVTVHDIDNSIKSGYGTDPVKRNMTINAETVSPKTPVDELKKLFAEKKHLKGVVVLNKEGQLEGIIGKSDLLAQVLLPPSFREVEKEEFFNDKMIQILGQDIVNLLVKIARIADNLNFNIFIVGGIVRDILLGIPNIDIDLSIDGNIYVFVNLLREKLREQNVEITVYEKFQTASISLMDGTKIDVATTRTEKYAAPGALPSVLRSTIKYDLYRRDFTINSMAIQLNRRYFGKLIDPFGGLSDLNEGLIKILHNLSFSDDPTRIFRAIKFKNRYDFKYEQNTLYQLDTALNNSHVLNNISSSRKKDELLALLNEADPLQNIISLRKKGILRFFHTALREYYELDDLSEEIEEVISWHQRSFPECALETAVIYLMGILNPLTDEDLAIFLSDYNFSKHHKRILEGERYHREHFDSLEDSKITDWQLYKMLKTIESETLLFWIAFNTSITIKKNINRYLLEISKIDTIITGKYIMKNFKIKGGPHIGIILEMIKKALIEKKIYSPEQEREYCAQIIESKLYESDSILK